MKPLPLSLKLGALIGVFISVSGCQFDPYAGNFTQSKPNKADIVGTYVLTGQTVNHTPIARLIAKDGSAPSPRNLILRPDGTFSISNMPVWVGDWANGSTDEWSVTRFVSVSGKWDVEVVGDTPGGVNSWGLTLTPADIPVRYGFLSGDKPPYAIIFEYSDPDEGRAMTYAKNAGVQLYSISPY